jgi:hypothetical protein
MDEIPDFYNNPNWDECFEEELIRCLPSWSAGLWCVHDRIFNLEALGENVNSDLRTRIKVNSVDIPVYMANNVSALSEIDDAAVHAANARRLFQSVRTVSLEDPMRLLLLHRRRNRLNALLKFMDRISALVNLIRELRSNNACLVLRELRNVVDLMQPELVIVSLIQRRVAGRIKRFREEVMDIIISTTETGELQDLLGPDSFVSTEYSFWYLSSQEDEESLIEYTVDRFLDSLFASEIMRSDAWDRTKDCTKSSERLLTYLHTLSERLDRYVPVTGDDLKNSLLTRIKEAYLISVFMTMSGADLHLALAPLRSCENLSLLHDSWIRRKKLGNLCDVLNSNFWFPRLHVLNRSVPRKHSPLTACLAVDSLGNHFCNSPQLVAELRWSVYDSLISSSLEHALSFWNETVTDNPDSANSYLASEVTAFSNLIRIRDQSILATCVTMGIVARIPTIFTSFHSKDDSSVLVEVIGDLQQQLSPIIEPNRWGFVYESIQAISLHSEKFIAEWACDHADRVPYSILAEYVRIEPSLMPTLDSRCAEIVLT